MPADYLARVGVAEREVRWHDRIVGGSRRVGVADRDGAVVGVVSWSVTDDVPELELNSLYVGADDRSHGLGRQLLAYALGKRDAYLWVFADNGRAQDFYARAGFVAIGVARTDPDTGLAEERWVRVTAPPRPGDRR